ADNDEDTGRKNFKGGVDYMFFAESGYPRATAYQPDGTLVTGPAISTLLKDNHLYLTADVDLYQERERSVASMQILSQTREPLARQSNTPFFAFRGAPISQE